ncbi:hypothetical protein DRE_01395 [Drechslerella stenobrocha 248]|uniref:AB hydrolase-1 domain-containing protein n=1 Tax=Drechslerella stenobrocha 248 TaxID=1043628 RepID=W7HVX9_9PEZI|nr:hypothetical protein DRE_01395 [Drechslerella stenobrocha 248]
MSKLLTLPELLAHPGMKDVITPFAPDRAGLAEVARGRGGPIKINYEVHGTGPICMVFIMGLRAPLIAWQRQIKYFGHENGDKFSMLVFDNRGVGASDKPLMRYTTSEMAEDVIEVVDLIGWTRPKQLHVIGVSMGGMIAQELSYKYHDRIASLVLQSTAAVIRSEVSFFDNMKRRAALIKPKSLEERLQASRELLFGTKYLHSPDETGIFPTNGDRFNAEELWKSENVNQPPFLAFISQVVAAGWHSCSPERLKDIANNIENILVLYGLQDKMIEPHHSEYLLEHLGPLRARKAVFEDAGHAISTEHVHKYNEMVREFVENADQQYGNNIQAS